MTRDNHSRRKDVRAYMASREGMSYTQALRALEDQTTSTTSTPVRTRRRWFGTVLDWRPEEGDDGTMSVRTARYNGRDITIERWTRSQCDQFDSRMVAGWHLVTPDYTFGGLRPVQYLGSRLDMAKRRAEATAIVSADDRGDLSIHRVLDGLGLIDVLITEDGEPSQIPRKYGVCLYPGHQCPNPRNRKFEKWVPRPKSHIVAWHWDRGRVLNSILGEVRGVVTVSGDPATTRAQTSWQAWDTSAAAAPERATWTEAYRDLRTLAMAKLS